MRPILALLLAGVVAFPAAAQQRPAAPPAAPAPAPAATPPAPVSSTPERTSATYGDWVLRCETRAAPAAGRGCELLQSLQDQRGQAVAQFALGRIRREDPTRLLVLIPANITIAEPMRLTLGEGGGQPIPVTLKACGPRGCVAETELSAALLNRLRAREVQGRLEFRNALNAAVALPFSTRGFAQALDALHREGF